MEEALRQSIIDTTLALVEIPSVIGDEKAICDYVEERLLKRFSRDAIVRHSHSLIVQPGPRDASKPTIGLFGHLDTVPDRQDGPVRIEGNRIIGCGVSDMKAGVALQIELLERLNLEALSVNLTVVFYEREEGAYVDNGLHPLLENYPSLQEIDLAFCLEPSDNKLQMGSLGGIHATLTFDGRRAHSARPWQGDNAIHKAGPVLNDLLTLEPKKVILGGLSYFEVMNVTMVEGFGTRNAIPDQFALNVNYRFAPGKPIDAAKEELEAFMDGRCDIVYTDISPSGPVCMDNPHLKPVLELEGIVVEPKQAWTDVARLALFGIDAANWGPGESAQAHQVNESCDIDLILRGYELFEHALSKMGSNT
jgi:succinyl-diaminopimelate desuccinylase